MSTMDSEKPISNVDDLRVLLVQELRTSTGAPQRRFSLEFGRDRLGRDAAWLTRRYRVRLPRLTTRTVRIPLALAFAGRLQRAWPSSAKTGRRHPQTVQALLSHVAGTLAVRRAYAEIASIVPAPALWSPAASPSPE